MIRGHSSCRCDLARLMCYNFAGLVTAAMLVSTRQPHIALQPQARHAQASQLWVIQLCEVGTNFGQALGAVQRPSSLYSAGACLPSTQACGHSYAHAVLSAQLIQCPRALLHTCPAVHKHESPDQRLKCDLARRNLVKLLGLLQAVHRLHHLLPLLARLHRSGLSSAMSEVANAQNVSQ